MRPTWGRQDPGGPHAGHMRSVIWDCKISLISFWTHIEIFSINHHIMPCGQALNVNVILSSELAIYSDFVFKPCISFVTNEIGRPFYVTTLWFYTPKFYTPKLFIKIVYTSNVWSMHSVMSNIIRTNIIADVLSLNHYLCTSRSNYISIYVAGRNLEEI